MTASGDNSTVVVAHQPNFLPWTGYFYKMIYSDVFVLLDEVEWTKNSYINRCIVPNGSESMWLTVPASPPRSNSPIREVRMADRKFAKKHPGTLRQLYGKTPYFDEVFPRLESEYQKQHERLADFNIALIEWVAGYLQMPCRLVRQSDLGVHGENNALLAGVTRAVGGDLYVSGHGAKKYIAGYEHLYEQAGIQLAFHTFKPPEYEQGDGEFVPGCSIIDLLFRFGPATRDSLAPQHDPPYEIANTVKTAH